MRRQTQTLLYHLLPVAYWLLAIGLSVVPLFFGVPHAYVYGFYVALPVLLSGATLRRIRRHSPSVEQCTRMALLLGVASYWMPTVVFLTIPAWGYLIYRNLFDSRSLMATLLGYLCVAIWAAVAIVLGWIANPWAHFFAAENALGWIPLGVILLAWLATIVTREQLRIR